MQDEAFLMHDVTSGRKYWSSLSEPITMPYTGKHKKIAAYGSIAKDGRQIFRTYDGFNRFIFIKYLKELETVIPDVPVRG